MGKNQAIRPDDGRLQAAITHCDKGHEFTPENTGWQRKHGKRFCRTCARQRRSDIRTADPEGFKARQRQHMAEWRAANPERRNVADNAKRAFKKAEIEALKALVGCSRCPERHTACLDFHHLDPTQKQVTIAVAFASWSLTRILDEIEKCIILCSNCHRKLHWEERQSS